MNEDAFAERDACGLTLEDWASLLDFHLDTYTGPALLWWALAGIKKGVNLMNPNPLPDLLTAVASDAQALAMLASSSMQEDVRALAPTLQNLHRRLATAVEIARRAKDLEEDDRRTAREALPACPPPPSSEVRPRR